MVVFYGIDPSGGVEPSCGGEEILVSSIEGVYYDRCESSSSYSE